MRNHWLTVALFALLMATTAFAEVLFVDNFEEDTEGKPPAKWVVGHEGPKNDAAVIKDPERLNNLVFSSPTTRHDVDGSIYVTGAGADWTDYYVRWEMLFPMDFYMGIVFRFSGGESFYLLDRRQNTSALDFWKREGGWQNFGSSEKLDLSPEKWFAFQLKITGDDFEVKMKDADDDTDFEDLAVVLAGTNGNFDKGDFGNYGYVLLDNVVVATELDDFINPFAVSPKDNLVTAWAEIKRK